MQVHSDDDNRPDWDTSPVVTKVLVAIVFSFLLGAAISAYVVYQIMKG